MAFDALLRTYTLTHSLSSPVMNADQQLVANNPQTTKSKHSNFIDIQIMPPGYMNSKHWLV